MSRRAPKGPAPGEWQYTIGEPPLQLTAFERTDKKLSIYTRLWDGKRYRDKKALCPTIRDARGVIVPEREIEAQRLTLERHNGLVAGLEPEEIPAGPLTLGAGFRRLLHDTEGKYPAESRQKADVRRASEIILEVLGRDLQWSQIRHAHVRKLWRYMANEHRKGGRFGPRQAEVVCEVLQSAARWLQQEGLIEPGEGEAARGWKGAMRKEWGEITGRPVAKPKKPRHTPEESERLWKALPEADPRLWLMMEIGAELRLGQVARTRRSDIHASPDGKLPLWMVRVHGRGKKLGEDVILTPEQREVLIYILTEGYLAELEARFRAGEIPDYPLFPGGQLVTRKLPDGRTVKRARPDRWERPITETGIGKWWRDLETLAKVPRQAGRRWYGMRRRQADEANKLDIEPEVKNRMGGWSKSTTREGYLEQGRLEDAEAAADARRRIRPKRESGE